MLRLLVLPVTLSLAYVPPLPVEKKGDLEKAQGTWRVESFVVEGQAGGPLTGAKMTFRGNILTLHPGDQGRQRTFKVRFTPGRALGKIDLIAQDGDFKGQTVQGVYQFQGATFHICAPNRPEAGPATRLEAPEGKEWGLMVLKRSK